jgi:4-hydroxy-3-polyprenylbenzoate decarboxylase
MENTQDPKRLIVAITGTTGSIFGVRALQLLQGSEWETHLMVSKWGLRTLSHETRFSLEELKQMATVWHPADDQGAIISSGSFLTRGMLIAPCSMRTLAAIAHGYSENLIHRAADVVLKERRKLVLVVRETPLNDIHLENMLKLSRMGAVIVPPVPAFYNHPSTLDDIIDQVAMRALDHFGLHLDVAGRWSGKLTRGS